MSESNKGNRSSIVDLLVTWVDEIRKESSNQSRRITRLETIVTVVGSMIVIAVSLLAIFYKHGGS